MAQRKNTNRGKAPPARRTSANSLGRSSEGKAGNSLVDRAYGLIEEMIVRLELAPGALLSEAALSKRLAIGRTPVREALHRLAREGLVVIMPRRGIAVSDINVSKQMRLLEVRRVLECLMAASAVRHATPGESARFRTIARAMERAAKANDDKGFMRLDADLNAAVAAAARNEFASAAMSLMGGLARRFWFQHYREVADLPRAAQLHAKIAKAIGNKDTAASTRAVNALLDYLEEFTRATLVGGDQRHS